MKIIFLLVLVHFSTSLSATLVSVDSLLHKSYTERFPLLLSIYHDELRTKENTKLFSYMRELKKKAREAGDIDLQFEAALMDVHYDYYHAQGDMKLQAMRRIDSLHKASKALNIYWCEIMTMNMLALTNFEQLGQYEVAFDIHHKVFSMIKDLHPDQFPHKASCLNQIGTEYYVFKDYSDALFFLKQGMLAEHEHTPRNYYFQSPNTIGLCYRDLGMLDSSDHYFQITKERSQKYDERVWFGISQGNLGYNLFLRGDTADARRLIQEHLHIANESDADPQHASILIRLSEVAIARQDFSQAEKYLDQVAQNLDPNLHQRWLQKYYELHSQVLLQKKEYEKGLELLESANQVREYLDDEYNSLQLARAKQKYELLKQESAIQNLRAKKDKQILLRNALLIIAGLTILSVLSILVWLSIRSKHKHLQQELRLKSTEQELSMAEMELISYTQRLSEKVQIIEKLKSNFDQNQPPPSVLLKDMKQMVILTDEDWSRFRNKFEIAYPGYLDHIFNRLPSVSSAEIRFICLSKLKLSDFEIASILGISHDSVKKQRYRLSKKLEDAGIDEKLAFLIHSS